ncbi:hypothetical protein LX32DRAFT_81833 [Colletotrichum zoysiae]|uniref:Uncharacterized protein n=1 Tax=Colletotrichum zoysiae TaxID=1216348 RepID=A0AAD9LXJ2_9PEZI|nr:hypothetical protein LX32DRAFT_81833 [Colletotrichum zoysiae]
MGAKHGHAAQHLSSVRGRKGLVKLVNTSAGRLWKVVKSLTQPWMEIPHSGRPMAWAKSGLTSRPVRFLGTGNQSVEEETDRVEGRLAMGWGCVVLCCGGGRWTALCPTDIPKDIAKARRAQRYLEKTPTRPRPGHTPPPFRKERGGSRTRTNQWCVVISVWRWKKQKKNWKI